MGWRPSMTIMMPDPIRRPLRRVRIILVSLGRREDFGMEENTFKTLYRRLVERCELSPQEAKKLLQRILTILQNMTGEEAP